MGAFLGTAGAAAGLAMAPALLGLTYNGFFHLFGGAPPETPPVIGDNPLGVQPPGGTTVSGPPLAGLNDPNNSGCQINGPNPQAGFSNAPLTGSINADFSPACPGAAPVTPANLPTASATVPSVPSPAMLQVIAPAVAAPIVPPSLNTSGAPPGTWTSPTPYTPPPVLGSPPSAHSFPPAQAPVAALPSPARPSPLPAPLTPATASSLKPAQPYAAPSHAPAAAPAPRRTTAVTPHRQAAPQKPAAVPAHGAPRRGYAARTPPNWRRPSAPAQHAPAQTYRSSGHGSGSGVRGLAPAYRR